MVKKELEGIIKKETGKEPFLETPPEIRLGDYAWPCFDLELKAREAVVKKLKRCNFLKDVNIVGGYINFFVKSEFLFKKILKAVDSKFGQTNLGKDRRVLIEYSSPNSNKSLHIGHMRNNFLGDSLARILSFQGFSPVKISIVNDRGVHVSKSMLMYQKYGDGKGPDRKTDQFVGYFYQMFEEKGDPDEAQELLRKWEAGDEQTIRLWQKMNNWVYRGWERTYKIQHISFDKVYYESQIYKLGKEIVQDGLNKGLFYRREDGAIEVDLSEYGLDKKVLIRADETSIYITMDLALAKLKDQDFPRAKKSIYVVDSSQDYHFKVLFKILEKLGYETGDYYHLSYGRVSLVGGKMSSRRGKVVNADDLYDQVLRLAQNEKIALAALRYYMLSVSPRKNIAFETKKAINFEGDTGPYIMYAYARGRSILNKSKPGEADFSSLGTDADRRLILLIEGFPEVIARAAVDCDPSLVANYLFELSQCFNSFYHSCPVKDNSARQKLVEAVTQVLKTGSDLLGIELLDKM